MIDGQSKTSPSRIYTYNDFFQSLRSLSVGGIYGQSYHITNNPYYSTTSTDTINNPSDIYVNHDSNKAFYISQSDPYAENAILYGIVNICAFLANAMVESIRYDSCEEWNGMGTGGVGDPSRDNDFLFHSLSAVNGRYFPMANACGQFGKLYSDTTADMTMCLYTDGAGGFHNYTAGSGGVDMSCPIDTSLEMEAAPHPRYNYSPDNNNARQQQGASTKKYGPPPFYCGPKRRFNRYAGYWDGYSQEFVRDVAYPSALGKVDVEGCCYWGR
jgi:hypothetical protein